MERRVQWVATEESAGRLRDRADMVGRGLGIEAGPGRALVIKHPERFILAFDNVLEDHWSDYYLEQVAVWRKALADLPPDVAHALAHRNAERLWHLPKLSAK